MADLRFLYVSPFLTRETPEQFFEIAERNLSVFKDPALLPSAAGAGRGYFQQYTRQMVCNALFSARVLATFYKNLLEHIDDHYVMVTTVEQEDRLETFLHRTGFVRGIVKRSDKLSYNLNVDYSHPRLNWTVLKFYKEDVEREKKKLEDLFLSMKFNDVVKQYVKITTELLYA